MKEDKYKVSFIYGKRCFILQSCRPPVTEYHIKHFSTKGIYYPGTKLWEIDLESGAYISSWRDEMNDSIVIDPDFCVDKIDYDFIHKELVVIKEYILNNLSGNLPKVNFFKIDNLFFSEDEGRILEVYSKETCESRVEFLIFSMSKIWKNKTGRYRYTNFENGKDYAISKRNAIELSYEQTIEELAAIIDNKIKYVMDMSIMSQILSHYIKNKNLCVLTHQFTSGDASVLTSSKIVSEAAVQNLKDGFSCIPISNLDAISLVNKGKHTTGDPKYIDAHIRSCIEWEKENENSWDKGERTYINYFDVFNVDDYSNVEFTPRLY